jgi:hypothetical protein
MTDHYQPVGPQESNFVRGVVDDYWKLQRNPGATKRERDFSL